jgi:hypothetical protein
MRYNLTQKQYKWLLELSSNQGKHVYDSIPYDIRSKAYYVLRECGYNREYNTEFRNELLELRNRYIEWKTVIGEEDDLPF